VKLKDINIYKKFNIYIMKYLKLFESFNEEDIHSICKKYGIKNYTINEDGSIDVDGSVNLYNMKLTKLPLKFNKVSDDFHCSCNHLTSLEGCPEEINGHFICSDNHLTSLKGCPKEIHGDFYCSYNKLTSLEGCPEKVDGDFYCSYNKLTSLEGCPEEINGYFYCSGNLLTSLEGCPKKINGDFYCNNNLLTSFEHCPKEIYGSFSCGDNKITSFDHLPFSIDGKFYCKDNPIYNIWELFEDYSKIDLFNDCDPIREPNIIILDRLNFFLEKIGKNPVNEIEGYKCV